MNTKRILNGIKAYFIITLGLLCYVMGWCIFLIPNNLVGGGVSGISSIILFFLRFIQEFLDKKFMGNICRFIFI